MGRQHNILTPAQQLVGKELQNGWKVEKLIDRPETLNRGTLLPPPTFVRSDNGEKAFLKAMDYMKALESSESGPG